MKKSETILGYCSLGGVCKEKTKRYREYARFLEDLIEKKSSLLFSNGGSEPDWCPGNCGDVKRKLANQKVCKKEGLNPQEWLDESGRPKIDWDAWRKQQIQNQNNGR